MQCAVQGSGHWHSNHAHGLQREKDVISVHSNRKALFHVVRSVLTAVMGSMFYRSFVSDGGNATAAGNTQPLRGPSFTNNSGMLHY